MENLGNQTPVPQMRETRGSNRLLSNRIEYEGNAQIMVKTARYRHLENAVNDKKGM